MKQEDIDEIIVFLEEHGKRIEMFTIIAAMPLPDGEFDVVVRTNEDKDRPLHEKLRYYAKMLEPQEERNYQ